MTIVFPDSTPGLPCSWDVTGTCCSTEWATYDAATQQTAAEFGAYIMWAATGRRYGLCTRTVRPCGRTCRSGGLGGLGGYYWSEGTWMPYIFNGVWRNCWCGAAAGCCTCEPTCQILLPGPVAAIPATGISQDGAIVPISSWRVDDGRWLVRTDGTCWPECQDYDADSGTNTLFVTYQVGLAVPAPVLKAAGQLACEWAKSCVGAACALPQRAQSIARQGVTVSMVNIDDLLKHGLTGIPTVDMVIRTVNPVGLTGRMRISSPDDPVTRITTIP